MTTLQRRTTSFDTRSVMLFAALTLGGMGALQAQNNSAPSSPSAPQFGPAKSAPSAGSGYSVGPGPANNKAANASAAAFERADTNQDGQLSAQEAAHLPAIGQRFQELDADRSGSLSRAEFEKGAGHS